MTLTDDALNLALAVSQAIDDDLVYVEAEPTGTTDYATFTCEDGEGHSYFIKVIRMDAEDLPVEAMSDYGEP